MHIYILRRLLYAIPTIIGVTLVIFVAVRILPGDVAATMFGEEGMRRLTPKEQATIEEQLGLSRPLYVQYGEWIKHIFQGKMGESFYRGDKVADIMRRRAPITGQIAVMAIVFAWIVGVPVGILAALKQDSVADYVARVFTIFFLSVPGFWVASLVVLVFLLGWGWKAPPGIIFFWDDPIGNLKSTGGPAIVLGLAVSGFVARMTRSSLLEVIHEDYVRTARSKGLAERVVILRHALRNALLPVLTLSGVTFGFLLGGSVTIEVAFGVPGLGEALVTSFIETDFAVIQNLVLVYGLFFVFINLFVDLAYAFLDPRIRLG